MLTEEIWKRKPEKLSIVQVTKENAEEVAEWVGAIGVTIIVKNDDTTQIVFEMPPSTQGNFRVYEGDYVGRDHNGHHSRYDLETLKKNYKRT